MKQRILGNEGFHNLPYLTTNYLTLPPGEDRGDSSSGKGEKLSVINPPCQSGVSTIYSTCNIPISPYDSSHQQNSPLSTS